MTDLTQNSLFKLIFVSIFAAFFAFKGSEDRQEFKSRIRVSSCIRKNWIEEE